MLARRVMRSVSFELLRYDNPDEDEEEDGGGTSSKQDPGLKSGRKRRKRRKSKIRNKVQQKSLSLSPDSSKSGLDAVDATGSSNGVTVLQNGSHEVEGSSALSQLSVSSASGEEVESRLFSRHSDDSYSQFVGEDEALKSTLESSEVPNLAGEKAAVEFLQADLPAEATSKCLEDGIPSIHPSPILRQRTISGVEKINEAEKVFSRSNSKKLETDGAVPPPLNLNITDKVDWRQVMSEEYGYLDTPESSPFQYLFDELAGGTSLEITTRAVDPQSRERVYNVLFNVPWRCELLIDVGFFVCLDAFLSLLTIMPIQICISIWNSFRKKRNWRGEDYCNISCLIILVAGVLILQLADISFIYHSIRFEPNIKLYMIYNMLEVFDKLFQSFGVDVLEVLFNSADAYASCSSKRLFELVRLTFDLLIALVCFILHSFIILSEAITISAALHHAATNKSLLVLLMSNNFAEIKSNVFKRFSKDNMHNMAHNDTVERFHILTYLFFVFVQNIMIVEGPWVTAFLHNAAMVMLCEAFVDLLKHSFLSKSNRIQPGAYSEFLKNLCEQVKKSGSKSKSTQQSLQFVPIGPACVVIRVLIPLYGAYVTSQSCWKNWLWSCVLAVGTFTFLAASKMVVSFSLRTYAGWYLKRCRDRERHSHAD